MARGVSLVGLGLLVVVLGGAPERTRVILDTDFAPLPADDALALLFALGSPELELVAVTTVAGNETVETATAEARRLLVLAGRTAVPVYPGARRPLVHRARGYRPDRHGRWWLDEPARGGAGRTAEANAAADLLLRATRDEPGALTIISVGPLTNLALAVRRDPGFARRVKRLVVMGGAIAALPDGSGNVTPNAEFNIWVDPEAARIVVQSGIPLVLSPLNIARQARLTRPWYEQLVASRTPLAEALRERLGPLFVADPDRVVLLHDPVAVASVVDPTLVRTTELYVAIDVNPGPNYGVTVGGFEPWPGGEGARKIPVQTGLDQERFLRLFVERAAAGWRTLAAATAERPGTRDRSGRQKRGGSP